MKHSLLQRLKQETLSAHEKLEEDLQLLRPDLSLSEYRVILESFYGFYAPWEQRAAPVLDRVLPSFFEERRKGPLLERDLKVLRSNVVSLPKCSSLPETTSLLPLLGSLYVLEGATLGGQILTRHFTDHLHLSCEEGCSFFCSYGAAVGQRWRAFCELLLQNSSPENDPVIVHSAVETFRCLRDWLGQGTPCLVR